LREASKPSRWHFADEMPVCRAMKAGESEAHATLKRLTLLWAQTNGFAIAAPEVRLPKSGYRVDVAACSRGAETRTAVFECKQARADLLKDSHAEQATRLRLTELVARRAALEEMFTTHCPELRRGEALWAEFDTWDFARLEHQTYRAVLEEIDCLQRRVVRGTKFSRMFRWRCADLLFLVVEDGIFAEAEIPAGWGLLMREGDGLVVRREPVALDPKEEQRRALLESIALAATRAVNRSAGIAIQVAAHFAALQGVELPHAKVATEVKE
jgi:hypothetical protein